MTGPLDWLDDRLYGDGDDTDPSELHGEAPPCDECDRQAVRRVDGRDLCEECDESDDS